MKTCPRCGADIPSEAPVCRFCGTPQKARGGAGQAQPGGGPRQAASRPRQDAGLQRQSAERHRQGAGRRHSKPANRRPYLLAAAVLGGAVLLVVVLALVAGGGGKGKPEESLPALPAQSSAPAAGAPQAESAPLGGPYTWTIEPSLDYEQMLPLRDYSGGTSSQKFLNVDKGGQTGVVRLADGKLILPLHEGERTVICSMGLAHNLPPEIEDFATDQVRSRALSDRGFPFGTHEADGASGDIYFAQHPETGALTLVAAFPGGYDLADEAALEGRLPAALPVINLDVAGLDPLDIQDEPAAFGLARTADRAMLLPVAYEAVGEVQGGVCPMMQGGAWGYVDVESGAVISECVWPPLWDGLPGFFAEGLCPVIQDGRWGYIDTGGSLAVPAEFEGATQVNGGLAWVKQGGLWGQIAVGTD